jgi:hypothetical protein
VKEGEFGTREQLRRLLEVVCFERVELGNDLLQLVLRHDRVLDGRLDVSVIPELEVECVVAEK